MSDPLILIPGNVDHNRGYSISKWRQYDNYECIYCQYATLFLARMQKHQLEGRHPWGFPSETTSDEAVDDGQAVD